MRLPAVYVDGCSRISNWSLIFPRRARRRALPGDARSLDIHRPELVDLDRGGVHADTAGLSSCLLVARSKDPWRPGVFCCGDRYRFGYPRALVPRWRRHEPAPPQGVELRAQVLLEAALPGGRAGGHEAACGASYLVVVGQRQATMSRIAMALLVLGQDDWRFTIAPCRPWLPAAEPGSGCRSGHPGTDAGDGEGATGQSFGFSLLRARSAITMMASPVRQAQVLGSDDRGKQAVPCPPRCSGSRGRVGHLLAPAL